MPDAALPTTRSVTRATRPDAQGAPGSARAQTLEALVTGVHRDPHTFLGAHPAGGGAVAFRALLPGEAKVTLAVQRGDGEVQRLPMPSLHAHGIFEAVVPDAVGARHWFEVPGTDGSTRRVEDPYRFWPQVSDFDLHLFRENKLDDVPALLGPQARTLDGVSGYRLAVWAPSARGVSVVGEFNGWDPKRHPMRLIRDSVWELFLPDAAAGQRYKFAVQGSDGKTVLKADPAARSAQLRPGNDSLLPAASTYHWGDDAFLSDRARRDFTRTPLSIYEVHAGSWMRGPNGETLNYRQLADRLFPYLKDRRDRGGLRFNAVQLLPVAEHPFDGSWGYQQTGPYAPTARYGTADDLKYFVDQGHQAGFTVLFDYVPAHFAKDQWAMGRFDGTALFEHLDPRQGEHKDWGTYVPNFGREEVANFLRGSALHFLQEFHLDGPRTDAVASALYLDYSRPDGEWVANKDGGNWNLEAMKFFQDTNDAIARVSPGALRIAEESTAFPKLTQPTSEGGLGFDLKWNMGWMNDTLRFFAQPPSGRRGAANFDVLTNTLAWAHAEKYVLPLSHDEVVHGKKSLFNKMPGTAAEKFANLRLLYAYMWSYPGYKLLFQGGEVAQPAEWNEAAQVDWQRLSDRSAAGVQALVADLNRLYQSEPALYEKQFDPQGVETVARDPSKPVLALLRKGDDPKDDVLFVHHFGDVQQDTYRVGVDAPGQYDELFHSDDAKYAGGGRTHGGSVVAEDAPWHGKPYSVVLKLPPLSSVALKRAATP